MNKIEINHAAIQKVIIVALGLMTFSVFFTSCASGTKHCAAYDQVDLGDQE